MESFIALAVQDVHSSCSETSWRAFSRVSPVINAVPAATDKGTALSITGTRVAIALGSTLGSTLGYGVPQTDDDTTKAPISGYLSWSPPV